MSNPINNSKSICTNSTTIPYCFCSKEAAEKAETELVEKFPSVSAYSIGKILYVVLHFKKRKSNYVEMTVDDYVKELGGCKPH